jgi:hypothetical protein
MKPIDIRIDTWQSIQGRIDDDRKTVLEGFRTYGPCSTRELEKKIGLSLFTIRPRTTELIQCFLVELAGRGPEGGIYAAVDPIIAEARFNHIKHIEEGNQTLLAL